MRRKQPLIPLTSPLYSVIEYILLFCGCFIAAASFNLLLNPNQIASGGVVGLSTIIQEKFGLEPAITQWGINIPLFIAGGFLLGRKFGIKTIIGTLLLPALIFVTKDFPALTTNPLLASIYGGIGIGAGLGIVFLGNGSTGGFSICAKIIEKYTGMSIGKATLLFDTVVIVLAGIVFDAEKALYALIVVFVTSKTIDMVQMGLVYSKVAYVISDKADEISAVILENLERGLTKIPSLGGYTGNSKEMLMVVMGQTEVGKFKTLVKSQDPEAFIIISDTHEVLGQGFKLHH